MTNNIAMCSRVVFNSEVAEDFWLPLFLPNDSNYLYRIKIQLSRNS